MEAFTSSQLAGVEQVDERRGFGAKADHRDLRQFLPHQVAFRWVVIAEDEAVEADIQVPADVVKARDLVAPGTFEGGKALTAATPNSRG